MATYQVLYWRDIPAQVRVIDGKRRLSKTLPERFQLAIDRIAMAEGLQDTEAYLNLWEWSDRKERDGEPQEVLDLIAAELEVEIE